MENNTNIKFNSIENAQEFLKWNIEFAKLNNILNFTIWSNGKELQAIVDSNDIATVMQRENLNTKDIGKHLFGKTDIRLKCFNKK